MHDEIEAVIAQAVTKSIPPLPFFSMTDSCLISSSSGAKIESIATAPMIKTIPVSCGIDIFSLKQMKEDIVTLTVVADISAVPMPWFIFPFAAALKVIKTAIEDKFSAAPPTIIPSN